MNAISLPYRGVLIVDDDPIMTSVTRGFLEHTGIESILEASDGHQALSILDQSTEPIDFIFCDLNMPKMDGLQFLRHLAGRQFTGEICIVSGEDQSIIRSAEILAKKYKLRNRGALNKPVTLDKLVTLLSDRQNVDAKAQAAQASNFSRSDLVFALVNRDLRTFYQPKIDTRTGELSGAEALARWTHPDLGPIPPSSFIPVAEREGLIDTVTGTVLRETLTALSRWTPTLPAMKLAVNLSGEILSNVELPDLLVNLCREADVDPARVVLEVTESRVLADSVLPVEVMGRLRMHKFELSIDDFGTGYSNIERLREYPFTELKIDQAFIRNAANDPFAMKCVTASVDLGRALGLRLVAEGVETAEEFAFVTDLGVDEVQGFFFSHALSFDDFDAKYFTKAQVA